MNKKSTHNGGGEKMAQQCSDLEPRWPNQGHYSMTGMKNMRTPIYIIEYRPPNITIIQQTRQQLFAFVVSLSHVDNAI